MFKILVVSDSHGNTDLLYDVISRNRTVDLVIHLGDHSADANEVMGDFPSIAHFTVAGNCDIGHYLNNTNYDGCFKIEERRVFYTHGHKYNVKYGTELLVKQVKMKDADIALFGHTHVSMSEEKDGVLVINPGSLSSPRDGTVGTYCIMEIDGKNVKYDIKEVAI